MAVAVKPSNSLINIRSSIKSVRSSFSGLKKKTGKLNNILLRKTKVKRESIARNYILSQRRQEGERRKNREDLIEASSIGGVIKRQAKAIASSTKGFLGRIMDFLGTLLVGWLLYNLPSIITMAQELIARMQRLSTIVSGFFNNTVSIFRGFGNVLGAIGKNILTFDFTDSNKRVENAVKGLGNTFDDMQSQFDEGFRLLTTSLGEGIASGEDAKPTGTKYENESMQEPSGGGGAGGASVGTSEQKAMLETIAFAEGTSKSYGTISGGGVNKDLESGKLTVQQVIDLGNSYGRPGSQHKWSGATGRYQFMPSTLGGLVAAGILKSNEAFTARKQDEAAIYLAKRRGVTAEMLKKEGMSQRVSDLLAPEWASFPYSPKGGKSFYGQSYKSIGSLQSTYKKSLGSPQTQTAPAQTSSAVSTSVIDQFKGKPGGAAGKITSERGMRLSPTTGKYRMHNGIDIAPAGPGYYVALKLSGTISDVSLGYSGGYGNYVDIKSGNTIYRFAHLAKVFVKRGQSYNGQTIGEIGSTGGSTGIHLHFEVRPGGGDSINPRPYLNLLSIGKQLTGTSGQPTTISAPTPAQIAPQGTQQRQQVSQQLAQQRNGPTIVVIEEDPPAQPQVSAGGGGGGIIPIIINPLNSFITKKLLLDLAYT
jgi:murein DD-endopeptidase MepM/ murein hydrolase activator NlpD